MSLYKPAGHNAVSPFLMVADARAILAFLVATFAATELDRRTAPDGSIKHAEVRIDDSVVMLGERPAGTHAAACSNHVYVADVDACYRRALAAGGQSVVEPRDQPYGDRSAGIRDPEGNLWWLGTHLGRPDAGRGR
ncbi:MAG TPA: VOC family protein [Rhodanobacter sp.]|nr:VOC family protein [Rhodanobacter sp.]